MRISLVHVFAAAAIGAMMALFGAPAFAKTAKECDAEYAANKDAIKTTGQTKKAYVASCRAGATATPADAAAPAAPATAAPASAPAAAPAPTAAGGKTAKECGDEYSTNKAAIKAGGQTKKAFVADCRAGTETIPTAAPPTAAPAPAPTAAPAPAPAPAAAAPTAPAPMAAKPKPMAPPSATEAELKARCPSDTIVWVNTKSEVYHFAGTRDYGNTKQGNYMCEMDAKAAGDRAAKNEKHP
jgi:hypothetical protein